MAMRPPAISFEGSSDLPIRNKSTCLAAFLPAKIAQTIKDGPLLISLGVKMCFILVWYLPNSAM